MDPLQPNATFFAELRTDVQPLLWALGAVLAAGLAALIAGATALMPMWAGLGAAGLAAIVALALAVKGLGRRAVVYRISEHRIEIERGYLGKRYESIDLFRIKDVVLEQGVVQRLRGVGRLTVYSTDQVEPVLSIGPIPDAQALFQKLRDAVTAARRATGAAVLQ